MRGGFTVGDGFEHGGFSGGCDVVVVGGVVGEGGGVRGGVGVAAGGQAVGGDAFAPDLVGGRVGGRLGLVVHDWLVAMRARLLRAVSPYQTVANGETDGEVDVAHCPHPNPLPHAASRIARATFI